MEAKAEDVAANEPKVKFTNDLSKLNMQNISDCIKMEIKAEIVTESTKAKIAADAAKSRALEEFLAQKLRQEDTINSKRECESVGWVMLKKEMSNTGIIKDTLTRDVENNEDKIKYEVDEKRKLETEMNQSLDSYNKYKSEVACKRNKNKKTIEEMLAYLDESRKIHLNEIEELKQQQASIYSSIDECRGKKAGLKSKLGEMTSKCNDRKRELNDEIARQESIKNDISNIPLEELKQKQLLQDKEYNEEIDAHQQKFVDSNKRLEKKLSELTEIRNKLKQYADHCKELTRTSADVTTRCADVKKRHEELQKEFETGELNRKEVLNELLANQEKCDQLDANLDATNQEISALKNRATEVNMQTKIASSKFGTLKITKEQLELQIHANKLIFAKERELKSAHLEDVKLKCAQLQEKLSATLDDVEVRNKRHVCERNERLAKADELKRQAELRLKSLEEKCADLKTKRVELLAVQDENKNKLEKLAQELTSAKANFDAQMSKLRDVNDRTNKKIVFRDSLHEQYKNLEEKIASIEQSTVMSKGSIGKSNYSSERFTESVEGPQPLGILKSPLKVPAMSKQVTFVPGLKGDSQSESSVDVGKRVATNNEMDAFDALFRTSPPVRERSSRNRFILD